MNALLLLVGFSAGVVAALIASMIHVYRLRVFNSHRRFWLSIERRDASDQNPVTKQDMRNALLLYVAELDKPNPPMGLPPPKGDAYCKAFGDCTLSLTTPSGDIITEHYERTRYVFSPRAVDVLHVEATKDNPYRVFNYKRPLLYRLHDAIEFAVKKTLLVGKQIARY